MSKLSEGANNVFTFMRDAIVEGNEQRKQQGIEEAVNSANQIQRDEYIYRAIMSCLEQKQDEMSIRKMLQKNFDVDSMSEADTYIENTRRYKKVDELQKYVRATGQYGQCLPICFSKTAIIDELKANPKLLALAPAKLKATIEKKQK